MALLTDLVSRLRLELGDTAFPFQAQVVADGLTDRFDLPVEMIEETGLVVAVDGAPLAPEDFTLDLRAGVLTLEAVPAADSVVVVQGSHYEAFPTPDMETFVNTAFLQHANGRYDDLGLPLTMAELPPVEDYLVVILAQIEALWAMVTDAAQEIDVRSPDGITIPVGQRYQQLMGLIAAKRAMYMELAQALNVGLHRIEMLTLRRVSRTTNRLVPIYQTMEYDQVNKGFVPDHGPEGTVVTIKGEGFTGTTDVLFNGVAATFTVVNDRLITTEVPVGATTGRIKIVNPGGETETHHGFTVGYEEPVVHLGAGAQRLYPPIDDGLI